MNNENRIDISHLIIKQYGMNEEFEPDHRGGRLWDNLEIARQYDEAAEMVSSSFPMVALLLEHEARRWRLWP